MILGILSDSHGERQRTARAVDVLRRAGATAFVHCGDIGGCDTLDSLAGAQAWVVCGNVDCPDSEKLRYANALGLQIADHTPLRLVLDGKILLAFHGHEALFERLTTALRRNRALPPEFERCDFILHGHTHVADYKRYGGVWVINPGALHRATTYTVATLDLADDQLRYWRVPPEEGEGPPEPYDLPRRS